MHLVIVKLTIFDIINRVIVLAYNGDDSVCSNVPPAPP